MCSFIGESMEDDKSLVFAYYKDGKSDPTFLYFSYALKEVKCWLIPYLSCCSTVLVELLVCLCNPLSIGIRNWNQEHIFMLLIVRQSECVSIRAHSVHVLWFVPCEISYLGECCGRYKVFELMNLVMIFEVSEWLFIYIAQWFWVLWHQGKKARMLIITAFFMLLVLQM